MPDILQVPWSELDRLIVLSPHLDDAALGCAGLLAGLRGRVDRLVVTLCAGDPGAAALLAGPSWLAPPHLRRAEDRAAMAALDCPFLHLGFIDAIYRRGSDGAPLYPHGSFIGPMHPTDEAHLAEVQRALTRLCTRVGRILVLAPLGVGGHIDHLLCARAASRLATGDTRLLFYEEFPYSVPGNRLTAGHPDALDPRERITALGNAPDQRLTHAFDLDSKLAILQHYPSQLPMLFGSEDALRQSLAAAVTETYWTIHPS